MTTEGRVCLRWDSLSEKYEKPFCDFRPENYCRYLTTKKDNKAWCYVEDKLSTEYKLEWCALNYCSKCK